MPHTDPVIARQQSLDALVVANDIRTRAAKLRRRVLPMSREEGTKYVADMIQRTTVDALLAQRMSYLLTWPRHRGPVAAHKLLAGLMIQPNRRLRELTPRQRGLVADAMRDNYVVSDRLSMAARRRDQRFASDDWA